MSEISIELLLALERLSEDDREVVIDRVVVGRSLRAVAETFGVTASRIHQRERRALRRLQVHLAEVGFVR